MSTDHWPHDQDGRFRCCGAEVPETRADPFDAANAHLYSDAGWDGLVRHPFVPLRSNRTKCDVCGRTPGVPSHQA